MNRTCPLCSSDNSAAPALRYSAVNWLLKAGGSMIVKMPNFGCWNRRVRGRRWCGFRLPDRVNYFDPRTLREIIRRTGFRIVRFSLRDRFPLSDNRRAVCQVV